jgi:hypothetical protein
MALTFKSAQLAGQQIAQQTGSMAANRLRPIAAGLNPGILSSPTSILQASGATPIEQDTNALMGGIGRSVMGAFNSSTSEDLLKKLVTGTKHVGDMTIGLLKSINKNTKQAAGGGIGGVASEFKEKAFKRRDWSKPSRYGPAAEMQAFLKKGGGLISDADLEKLTRLFSEERKIAEEKENARAHAHANKEAARRKKFETQKERKENRKAALEKFVGSKPVRAAAFMGGNLVGATKGVVKTTTGFLSWLLSPKNLLLTGAILSGVKSLLTNWLESDEFSLASFVEGATFGMVKAETAQKVINEIKAVLIGTKEEPGLLLKALSTYKDLLGIDQADGAFKGTLGIIGTGLKNFFIGTEEKGYKDGLLGLGYNSIRKVLKDKGVTDNLPNIKDISMGGAAVGAVIGAALTGGVGLIPGAVIGALAPGYLKKKYSDPNSNLGGFDNLFTMSGAISGAAIGFMVGGPLGALAGAVIGGLGGHFLSTHLKKEAGIANILLDANLSSEQLPGAQKNVKTLTDSFGQNEIEAFNLLSSEEKKKLLLLPQEEFEKRTSENLLKDDGRNSAFGRAEDFTDTLKQMTSGSSTVLSGHEDFQSATQYGERFMRGIIKPLMETFELTEEQFNSAVSMDDLKKYHANPTGAALKTIYTKLNEARIHKLIGADIRAGEHAAGERSAGRNIMQNASISAMTPTVVKYTGTPQKNELKAGFDNIEALIAAVATGLNNLGTSMAAVSQQQSGPGIAVSLNPSTPTIEASKTGVD